MSDIVQKGDPVLRRTAEPVPEADITSVNIQHVLDDMSNALATQQDGVALAAPQIGIPLRIFIVAAHAIEGGEDMVCINPEIIKASKKQAWQEEGCLSIRWYYGEVKRHTNVTISAYDRTGGQFTRGAGGLLAQIFQHEIDHLDGILFVDKAREIENLPPDSYER